MSRLGRPSIINKQDILAKCCNALWYNGIQNISFNEVIKTSEVSKGTIYKIFKDQDTLHKETINYYYKNIMSNKIKSFSEYDNVFNFLEYIKKNIIKKDIQNCFYQETKTISHQLGDKAKSSLIKIDNVIKKAIEDIVIRHVKKYKLKIKKDNIYALALFLFHNLTYLYILKLNKTSTKEISTIFKILKAKTLVDLK